MPQPPSLSISSKPPPYPPLALCSVAPLLLFLAEHRARDAVLHLCLTVPASMSRLPDREHHDAPDPEHLDLASPPLLQPLWPWLPLHQASTEPILHVVAMIRRDHAGPVPAPPCLHCILAGAMPSPRCDLLCLIEQRPHHLILAGQWCLVGAPPLLTVSPKTQSFCLSSFLSLLIAVLV